MVSTTALFIAILITALVSFTIGLVVGKRDVRTMVTAIDKIDVIYEIVKEKEKS
jgi:hypothetical protein